jgi:3-deoxy-D-manno-octulosonate 8-phosphate phosphatase (KDO 8-P phosphatase)
MKYIIVDIDGILTDGSVFVDAQGNENKKICYRDLDAVGVGRRAGYEFVIITGENTPIAKFIVKRFGVKIAFFGAKNKLQTITEFTEKNGINIKSIIYIGDSDNDVDLLEAVGLGIAPADGTFKARNSARVITDAKGGSGVLLEVIDKLLLGMYRWPGETL